MGPELSVLKKRMGAEADEVKGGCCGLAGSCGFEEGKYDISMQCGEIVTASGAKCGSIDINYREWILA